MSGRANLIFYTEKAHLCIIVKRMIVERVGSMLLYLCTNNIGHIYPHARREFFFANSSFEK